MKAASLVSSTHLVDVSKNGLQLLRVALRHLLLETGVDLRHEAVEAGQPLRNVIHQVRSVREYPFRGPIYTKRT